MDYLDRSIVITSVLNSRDIFSPGVSQRDVAEEGGRGRIKSVRKIPPSLVDFDYQRRKDKPSKVGNF